MPARPDPSPSASMSRGGERAPAWLLPALIALLVCVRGVSVLGLADVFYYGEELARGSAAKAIVDALPVAHYKLGHWYFEGGAFTVAHLTALLFLGVGPCILAHKLSAILVSVLILWAGFALARATFGARTAAVFGVSFAFAPESFHRLSYLNLGNHFAATLFLLLILSFAFRIAFDGARGLRPYAGLGLAAGFGVYFSFQSLPAVAFAGALIVLTRWRELHWRTIATGTVTFVIGLSPFLWMWSQAGKEVFRIHDGYLFDSTTAPAHSGGLLDFVASHYRAHGAFDRVYIAVLQLMPIAGLALFWWQRARDTVRETQRYAALCAYLAFFAAVYARSGFTVGSFYNFFNVNRMSPLWILGALLTSATIVRLVTSRAIGARVAGVVVAGFLAIAGVRDAVHVWSECRFESLAANWTALCHTKGYSYADYLPYFRTHLEGPLESDLAVVLAFDEPCRPWLEIEAVQCLIPRADRDPEALFALFRQVEPERWREFLPGLGPYLLAQAGMRLEATIDRAQEASGEERRWRMDAIGRWGPGSYRTVSNGSVPPGIEREITLALSRLAPEDREPYFRGLGHRYHRTFALYPVEAYAAIARAPVEAQSALRAGYDEARAWNRLP